MLYRAWLVLQVAVRTEEKAHWALTNKGYETFLPTYFLHKHGLKLTKPKPAPLFPGYVFCRPTESAQGLVVTTPGVLRILSFGGRPATLEDDEINAIRHAIGANRDYGPHAYLTSGERVVIIAGPLRGLSGIIVRGGKKNRVVLSVDLLMRSMAVELDASDITSASQSKNL